MNRATNAFRSYNLKLSSTLSTVVHDVPSLSISQGDYTLTAPTDPEYSFYSSLLDNSNPQLSGTANPIVRQQYDVAKEMLMNSGTSMANM